MTELIIYTNKNGEKFFIDGYNMYIFEDENTIRVESKNDKT